MSTKHGSLDPDHVLPVHWIPSLDVNTTPWRTILIHRALGIVDSWRLPSNNLPPKNMQPRRLSIWRVYAAIEAGENSSPEISFGLDETAACSHRERGVSYRSVPVPRPPSSRGDLEAVLLLRVLYAKAHTGRNGRHLKAPAASTSRLLACPEVCAQPHV